MKKYISYFLLSSGLILCILPVQGSNNNNNNIFTTSNEPCDRILTIDGEEIAAVVIEITSTVIKYKACDFLEGPTRVKERATIFLIKYRNGTTDIINPLSSKGSTKESPPASISNTAIRNSRNHVPTSPNMAKIYIIRPSIYGMPRKLEIYLDGKYVGATKGRNYIELSVEPGSYTILSKGENESKLTLDVISNGTYYIKQIPKTGLFKIRSKLEVYNSKEEAKGKLQQCKRAKA